MSEQEFEVQPVVTTSELVVRKRPGWVWFFGAVLLLVIAFASMDQPFQHHFFVKAQEAQKRINDENSQLKIARVGGGVADLFTKGKTHQPTSTNNDDHVKLCQDAVSDYNRAAKWANPAELLANHMEANLDAKSACSGRLFFQFSF